MHVDGVRIIFINGENKQTGKKHIMLAFSFERTDICVIVCVRVHVFVNMNIRHISVKVSITCFLHASLL